MSYDTHIWRNMYHVYVICNMYYQFCCWQRCWRDSSWRTPVYTSYMSHVSCICHTWVMSLVYVIHESCLLYMSYMSHVSYTCHTWVMSLIYDIHESCLLYMLCMSHVSCICYTRVMSLIYVIHESCLLYMSYMSHVSYTWHTLCWRDSSWRTPVRHDSRSRYYYYYFCYYYHSYCWQLNWRDSSWHTFVVAYPLCQ